MDIEWAHVLEVDAVYACRDLHVVTHAGLGGHVVNVLRDLEESTAIADAEFLHRGADGQANGRTPSCGVGHHEILRERVEPAGGAFDGGVERLEVDADIGALSHVSPFERVFQNLCSIIEIRPDIRQMPVGAVGLAKGR